MTLRRLDGFSGGLYEDGQSPVVLGQTAADLAGFHGAAVSQGTLPATSLTSASSWMTIGSNHAAAMTSVVNLLKAKGLAS